MENQHRKIKGYRELSQEEIDTIHPRGAGGNGRADMGSHEKEGGMTSEEKDDLILRLRRRIETLKKEVGRAVVVPTTGETPCRAGVAKWAICDCGEPVARFDLKYQDAACRKCGALLDWSHIDNPKNHKTRRKLNQSK